MKDKLTGVHVGLTQAENLAEPERGYIRSLARNQYLHLYVDGDLHQDMFSEQGFSQSQIEDYQNEMTGVLNMFAAALPGEEAMWGNCKIGVQSLAQQILV